MAGKRVLSVGQCGADHGGITRTLRQAFGAEVVAAHSAAEALGQLQHGDYALVLVNRVLDWDGSSGVDLVRAVKQDEALRRVPVMLVSNYADAQDASQHTFLKCWRAGVWTPEVRNLRAWIFGVGLNAARDLQR